MKKVFLLTILPALLVLSSCGRANRAPAQEFFKEDTTLHEELFGQLSPRKLGVPDETPGSDPSWTKAPKVGVQFKSYQKDKDDDGTPEDYLAVRYIAAIADTEGMTATWSRGVSQKDSNQIRVMAHDKVSATKYDSLNNGGTPRAATAEGSGYEKYVVYSMYDIPASEDESYIAAYLTLSKDGEEPVKSKVVAAQIDGSYAFSFESSKNGYFLQGTLGGVANTIWDETESDTTDPNNGEKDNSLFEEKTFAAGDKFGLFRFTPSLFQFFGYSTFASSTSARFIKSTSVDQFNELYLPGTYTLYVNYINMIYTSPISVDMDLYLAPNDNWKTDGARFALYAFGVSDTDWFDMVETGSGTGIYKVKNDEKINLGKYSKVIFCRMNPGETDNDWPNMWNQTIDLIINGVSGPGNMSLRKYCVEGWDNGDGTWSSLS